MLTYAYILIIPNMSALFKHYNRKNCTNYDKKLPCSVFSTARYNYIQYYSASNCAFTAL